MAGIYLRNLLDRAVSIGHAVTNETHRAVRKGNIDEARRIAEQYTPEVDALDKELTEWLAGDHSDLDPKAVQVAVADLREFIGTVRQRIATPDKPNGNSPVLGLQSSIPRREWEYCSYPEWWKRV